MVHRFVCVVFCCAGPLLLSVQPAAAARLLDVYIDKDGETIAHTYYEDGGRADAATVWRYLATPPIMVDEDVTQLEVADANPLTLDLQGDLELRIQHTSRVIARTSLSELELRRMNAQTQSWYLSADEMERTAFAAGFSPAENANRRFNGFVATIVTSLLILFACIALTALLMRGPKSTPTE